MRILAIGDVVGENGLKKLKQDLPNIKEQHGIDFVIVNGENAAEGMGINLKIFKELQEIGADVVTMGNHTWGKKDIFGFISDKKLLRPANYNEGTAGHGYEIYECKGKTIGVINLIGRTDMYVLSENPFLVVNKIINNIKDKVNIIVVDFHAEATAEKIAMGYHLDGRATIVFGTHTHVQTADEQILEHGTGYITDIGMTGPKKSVIGMDVSSSLKRFVTGYPEKYRVATGESILNGVIFDVNEDTNKVQEIIKIK